MSTTDKLRTFTKSLIVEQPWLRVKRVITPVDSILALFPPLGFISSMKLYDFPALVMTKGEFGEDNRLLIK